MVSRPKLAVCISYFNNVKEIPRLLDPIVEHVDLIIAIDGKYPKFDWPTNLSTDGSTELLIEKYNAVVQVNKSPIEQIDKRNQYLEIAENANMDFVLVLDTDDYLHPDYQDWDLFYQQLADLPDSETLGNVWVWMSPLHVANWNMVTDNTWSQYTRIIRPSKIRYDVTHWTYCLKGDNTSFEVANQTLEGLRFDSDSRLRSKKYSKAGYKWAEEQMNEENARFQTPANKRKRFNFWTRQLHKALSVPGTKITYNSSNLDLEV